MLHGFSPLAVFAPILQSKNFPPHRRYLGMRARFDRAVSELIAQRRRQSEARSDVLSLLLEARYDDGAPMDEEEMRHQLLTILIAGHVTTAITFAWVLDFVLRRPELAARLREEMAGVSDPEAITKLPLLAATLDETMRLAPVVTDVARITKVPFELEPGFVVPAGRAIAVAIKASTGTRRSTRSRTSFVPTGSSSGDSPRPSSSRSVVAADVVWARRSASTRAASSWRPCSRPGSSAPPRRYRPRAFVGTSRTRVQDAGV